MTRTATARRLATATAYGGGSVALGGQTSESFNIPGTESQNALDRLEAVFPSVAGASVQVVAVAPDGATGGWFIDAPEGDFDE